MPHKFKSEVPAAVSPTGQGRPGRPGPGRQEGPLPRSWGQGLGALQSVGPSGEPPGSLGICKVGLKLKPQQDRALDLMGVGVAAWFPPGRSRGGCGGNPDAHLARLCVLDGSEHEDPAPRGSAPFLKMSTMVTSTPTTHIQDFKALEMLPLEWRLEKLHPHSRPQPRREACLTPSCRASVDSLGHRTGRRTGSCFTASQASVAQAGLQWGGGGGAWGAGGDAKEVGTPALSSCVT